MAHYIVKNRTGTFTPGTQPDEFTALLGMENRMFIVSCSTEPNSEFVVELPPEIHALLVFYLYAGNKKMPFDPFNGEVQFEDVIDKKGRRRIMYTEAQYASRLAMFKWMMLNVYLPDKARMQSLPQTDVDAAIVEINALPDDIAAHAYLTTNLYYDL